MKIAPSLSDGIFSKITSLFFFSMRIRPIRWWLVDTKKSLSESMSLMRESEYSVTDMGGKDALEKTTSPFTTFISKRV